MDYSDFMVLTYFQMELRIFIEKILNRPSLVKDRKFVCVKFRYDIRANHMPS